MRLPCSGAALILLEGVIMQIINDLKKLFDDIFFCKGKRSIRWFSFLAYLTFVNLIVLTNYCLAGEAITIEMPMALTFNPSYQTSIGTLKSGFTLLKGSNIEFDSSENPTIVSGFIAIPSDQAFAMEEGDIKISKKGIRSPDNKLLSPQITFVQDQNSGKWLATNGPLVFDPFLKILNASTIKIIGGHENPIMISGKQFYDTIIVFKDGNLKIKDTNTQQESTTENNEPKASKQKDNKATDTVLEESRRLNTKAKQFHDSGQFDKAIELLTTAVHLSPQYADAYSNLAAAYAAKGQGNKALSFAKKAIVIDPYISKYYITEGLSYYRLDKLDQSIIAFNKAIEIGDSEAETFSVLGNAYFKKGMLDEAIEHYKQAIALNPNLRGARNNLKAAEEEKAGKR